MEHLDQVSRADRPQLFSVPFDAFTFGPGRPAPGGDVKPQVVDYLSFWSLSCASADVAAPAAAPRAAAGDGDDDIVADCAMPRGDD
eukprot:3898205-Alexandrium_andersonii.AAC.1